MRYQTEIKNLLKKFFLAHSEFQDCEIEQIKHGHNRTVFLMKLKNGKKYIIKKGNESKDLGSSNLNDVRVQNFLKLMKCNFVPKIVYYDEDNDIYIETCVGDEGVKFNDLSNGELDIVAKQLVFIHSLSFEQYKEFCTKNNFEQPKITTPLDSIDISGFARFEIVKKLCPDQYVKNWLDTRLQQNLKNIQEMSNTDYTAHLNWGDIGENIRKDSSALYFIDWEFAKFGFGSELSYIKIHSHLLPEKFNYLVSRYSIHSGITKENLLDEIDSEEKVTRINDVVWAAMKWGQSKSAEEIEKYKELTYKRIKLAEKI